MEKESLGLALLATSSVFGAWAAWINPVLVSAQVDPARARRALRYGALSGTIIALGTHLVFGKRGRLAALAAAGATGLLYQLHNRSIRTLVGTGGVVVEGKIAAN